MLVGANGLGEGSFVEDQPIGGGDSPGKPEFIIMEGEPPDPAAAAAAAAEAAQQVQQAQTTDPIPEAYRTQVEEMVQRAIAPLQEREGQQTNERLRLRVMQEAQRLDAGEARMAQEFLPNANNDAALSQQMARIWRAGQAQVVEQQLKSEMQIEEQKQHVNTAARLSEEHGMSVRQLMEYQDARSMETAAKHIGGLQKQIDELKRGQSQQQQAAAKQNQPAQTFEGPGSGAVPLSVDGVLQRYNNGELGIEDPRVKQALRMSGFPA